MRFDWPELRLATATHRCVGGCGGGVLSMIVHEPTLEVPRLLKSHRP